MFGFEKMGGNAGNSTGPEASREAMRPQHTDDKALELLREKVVEEADGIEGIREEDIDLVTNYLAIKQEKTGVPYAVEEEGKLNTFDEGFDDEIFEAIQNRLSARGGVSPRIEDAQGVVASAEDLPSAVHRIEEEREAN